MNVLKKDTLLKANNKLRRKLLALPLLENAGRTSYEKKLADHVSKLPHISAEDQNIVDSMFEQGIFVTNLSFLDLPKTTEAVQTAKELIGDSSACDGDSNKSWIRAEVLNEQPDLLLWATDERLLDIVENYIGLPIYYLGVEVRHEFSDGKAAGVRQWHIDTEDRRMLKIIVYLNDVDEQGGPFEYMSKDLTQEAVKKLRYDSGLVSDEKMSESIPESKWTACVGSENTAIFVDPCNIFHRAKPPAKKDRFSITFHYISQSPLEFRNENIFSDRPFIREMLSERQLSCLLWR
jgi:hypothetical protein